VTSRLSNWPGAVESLALDVLEESDAVAFLLECTQHRRRRKTPDDDAQARNVAVEPLGRPGSRQTERNSRYGFLLGRPAVEAVGSLTAASVRRNQSAGSSQHSSAEGVSRTQC